MIEGQRKLRLARSELRRQTAEVFSVSDADGTMEPKPRMEERSGVKKDSGPN